jgi:Tfp pilus assembly protein PilP
MARLGFKKNGWVGAILIISLFSIMMLKQVYAAQDQQIQETGTSPTRSETQTVAETTAESPDASASQELTAKTATAPEKQAETQQVVAKRARVMAALLNKDFSYNPANMIDPFVSFIVQQAVPGEARISREDEDLEPKPQMPLTPLQKMAVGQIQRGFKAVLWGEMGMRALIEDDAGKGYIVAVGTPLGGNNGIVTDIQNDRLVIQQDIWDAKLKQMVPSNVEIKLSKIAEKR